MQCRSRKLRCDREYPFCGRCQKGKNPAQCTYEDGFLWQQPNTVPATTVFSGAAPAAAAGGGGVTTSTTASPTTANHFEANSSNHNGTAVGDDNQNLSLPRIIADRTPVHTPDSGITSSWAPPRTAAPSASDALREDKRDRFLETVLGAPKAAVNQEPFMNTEVLQRHSHHHPHSGSGRPSGHYLHHYPPPHYSNEQHHHRYSPGGSDEDESGRVSPSQQLDLSPRIMMRGKETRTRFNGSSVLANVMAQVRIFTFEQSRVADDIYKFPDIKSFAEDIRVSSPHMAQLRPDLERVKRGVWKKEPLNKPLPVPDTMTLIILLPSRRVVDDLVILYLTYIESTHRILHVPSFLRELEHFWAQKETPDIVSPAFVVQLLLVLACAWNLADPDTLKSKSDDSLKCYTALEWILYAEKWLQNASIKRPEITVLRLYVLLLVALNSHGMERSKAWITTGTMVKQAMLAGYHRDPSHYTKISMFNKEMRRRIWTTIVELDLQVALDRGMPPSVQVSDYDSEPALNINDNEIQETATELPTPRPLGELTDCSFQSVLTQSLPLRLRICRLMHSPRISCHYDEILRMDWELGRHLSKIPTWSISDADDLQSQHKVILLKALLETRIGHCLLSLHTPFAIEASEEPLFAPSSRTRMEVAAMLLSTQRRLYETARPLALCNTGDLTMQAFCSICQLLHADAGGASRGMYRSSPIEHSIPLLSDSVLSLHRAHHQSDSNLSRVSRDINIASRGHHDVSRGTTLAGRQRCQGIFLHVHDPGAGQGQTLAGTGQHVQAGGDRSGDHVCADAAHATCELCAFGAVGHGVFPSQPCKPFVLCYVMLCILPCNS